MEAREALLTALLETLTVEEELLDALAGLAAAQGKALMENAFLSLQGINEQMLAVTRSLVPLEKKRIRMTRELGVETLTEASALAIELHVTGFEPARERLLASATAFRTCQERNAILVLNAVRLRDRWSNFITGMTSPTYGAEGKRDTPPQRQIVSRSA